jgi:hypothetical protein
MTLVLFLRVALILLRMHYAFKQPFFHLGRVQKYHKIFRVYAKNVVEPNVTFNRVIRNDYYCNIYFNSVVLMKKLYYYSHWHV